MPFVSICIPTYKRLEFLKRLLDSIAIQTFKDFEVIITDDSAGNDVYLLVREYSDNFRVSYFKNVFALGTPENWNEAIRHATGIWIKLMHDDDWFADSSSLLEFVNAARQNPASTFFYSAYFNVPDNGKQIPVYANSFRRGKLAKNPVTLFSRNVIGPPSVTLVINDKKTWYDHNIKWVVDIDFYIRFLANHNSFYIPKPLINVGVHEYQVTQSSFGVPGVEIPEGLYLLNKVGGTNLGEILVYDAFWRMLRNLNMHSEEKIVESGYKEKLNPVIKSMISWQSRIPRQILKIGAFSKTLMFLHYVTHRRFIRS